MLRSTRKLREAGQRLDRGPVPVGTLCPQLSTPSHTANLTSLVGNGHRNSFHPVREPSGRLASLVDRPPAVTANEIAQDRDSIVPVLRRPRQSEDPSELPSHSS